MFKPETKGKELLLVLSQNVRMDHQSKVRWQPPAAETKRKETQITLYSYQPIYIGLPSEYYYLSFALHFHSIRH